MIAPVSLIEKRLAEIGHVESGLAKLRSGDTEAALADFSAALALNPTGDKRDLIARCHHRLGQLDQAIAGLEQIAADPARAGKRLAASERGLLYALRDAGRWDEADRIADRLTARFDASPAAIATALLEADMPLMFPGWMRFFDKGALAESLSHWHAAHPEGEPFWPQSFVLPREAASLTQYRRDAPPGTIFVVKPTASSGGKNVRLTRDPVVTTGRPVIVQRHVDDPFLIDGRKAHVRLYLLASGSADAPRFYLYREGIVRIAPEPYATDDAALARAAIHVTNTALHQRHPALAVPQDADDDDTGNIRSLSALLRHMDTAGLDGKRVWTRLLDLARDFFAIVSDSGLFRDQAAAHTRYCFPPLLFGLDVLIDATGRPWLIECQRAPAIAGSPLVNRINAILFQTVFGMSVYRLAAAGLPTDFNDPDARAARERDLESRDIGLFQRLF